MSDPTIRLKRLAWARVTAPDLDEAMAFLGEFGLAVATRTDDTIYLRGTDPEPACYVLTEGDGNVEAIAFEAEDRADLEAIARVEGASPIEKLEGPGGGEAVRLRDPQGMVVEIVHGVAPLAPLETPGPVAINMGGRRERIGDLPAVRPGPSHVKRLGHLVLESADPDAVYRWYHAHLGLRKADEIKLPDGRTQILFSHLDRGPEYVDHHVVGFQYAFDEGARVQHLAFEVDDFDDLMAGHDHLARRKRRNVWGVGRHRFGGQIFDYWKSPWGLIHEHWTDTDVVNEDHVPTDEELTKLRDYWGPPPKPAFVISRWNGAALRNIAGLVWARIRGARR